MHVDPEDLCELLVTAPGTKEEKQAFFTERYDARVARTNYDVMWERLSDKLGDAAGAKAVLQYVAEATNSRILRMVQRASVGREVEFRMNEPAIIGVLFQDDGELSNLGIALSELLSTGHPKAGTSTAPKPTSAPQPKRSPSELVASPSRRTTASAAAMDDADVVLRWHEADPKNIYDGPWQWSRCLYAYVHPAERRVLYIGKTDDQTVRQRFVSNFQRKFQDLYARLNILKVDVIAADIELRQSARLTREWIDDLESLLIMRLQPPLNKSKKRSRGSSRPGTVVVCSGDWPLQQSRFVDRG